MENINTALLFVKDNLLFFLVPLLILLLFLLKPFRKLLKYMFKNTLSAFFYIFISSLCTMLGYTLSVNVFTVMTSILLGLPGISLILFLSLIIG